MYAQTRSRHTHIRALPRVLVCGCAVSRCMSNPSIGPPICLGRRVSVDVHACTHPYTHIHRYESRMDRWVMAARLVRPRQYFALASWPG